MRHPGANKMAAAKHGGGGATLVLGYKGGCRVPIKLLHEGEGGGGPTTYHVVTMITLSVALQKPLIGCIKCATKLIIAKHNYAKTYNGLIMMFIYFLKVISI